MIICVNSNNNCLPKAKNNIVYTDKQRGLNMINIQASFVLNLRITYRCFLTTYSEVIRD